MFGRGCLQDCAADIIEQAPRTVLLVTGRSSYELVRPLVAVLESAGIAIKIQSGVRNEPTVDQFHSFFAEAAMQMPEVVVGVGGGSALDVAKLIAALLDSDQQISEIFDVDRLHARRTRLVCMPTTAGTGSEVSPNAVLLDTADSLKKGVVSRHLVPDAAYVDPCLTTTVPPAVTAATGMDALTHCIEAYANRFAHPAVDLYALAGIKLIGRHLCRVVQNGDDLDAREGMALGSMYGGLCLGPVNTAAVHALSYPLGGEFHIAHGLANAILLPHVLEFNLPAMPERYAEVAKALGVVEDTHHSETARRGVEAIKTMMAQCRLSSSLRDLGIPESAIPGLAASGMTISRLLKNNPREMTTSDAETIYWNAYR